jgi:nicotinamidase/pyrazinamidase
MKNAFIIVDLQKDFCEGGSLEVQKANEVIPIINQIRKDYEDKCTNVILTQDYHPEDHISFKDSPYLNDESLNLDELTQKWKGAFPRHCVQGTEGSEMHPLLNLTGDEIIIKKGEDKFVESFSGFGNPLLAELLDKNEINNVFVVGLAYDYCVGCTALDSSSKGYNTYVLKDASRAISEDTTCEMENRLIKSGVKIITSQELKKYI